MDIGTMVDAHSVELLTGALGLVFTVLYSFVKPSDWTPQIKRNVSIALAGAVGVYVAYTNGKTNPTDYLGYATLAVGVSQLAYKQVLARFGVEDKIVAIRGATIDLGASPMNIEQPYGDMIRAWAAEVGVIGAAFKTQTLTAAQANLALSGLRVKYPNAPNIYPENWFGS